MTSPSLLKTLKNFCCCLSSEEDDNQDLIRNEQEPDWAHTSNANRHLTNGATHSGYAAAGSSHAGESFNSESQMPRTQSEADEETLNKILERTQQNIIDVGNLDSNNGVDIDIAHRARLYADAIKRHDADMEKRQAITHNNGSGSATNEPIVTVSADPFAQQQLLADLGGRVSDVLAEPANRKLDDGDVELLNRTAELLAQDVHRMAHVELHEELIAYMSQDD